MAKDIDFDSEEQRIEQFYRLLNAYGLTGRNQPLTRQKKSDIDTLFPSESGSSEASRQ